MAVDPFLLKLLGEIKNPDPDEIPIDEDGNPLPEFEAKRRRKEMEKILWALIQEGGEWEHTKIINFQRYKDRRKTQE